MWPFFAAFPEGEQPFACFDGKEADSLSPLCRDALPACVPQALDRLRYELFRLGEPSYRKFKTHDFRRGHTQDLVAAGATDEEVCRAGQWKTARSSAPYVDWPSLECDSVDRVRRAMEPIIPDTADDAALPMEGEGLGEELEAELRAMLSDSD